MHYEGLMASVIVGTEQTKWFRFQIGVFQGCTLSTMLFDTTFNTLFDSIEVFKEEYGYTFSSVDLIKLVTGYADDIALVTETAVANQFIIAHVECLYKLGSNNESKASQMLRNCDDCR